jgi:hypothetical protein
MQQNYVLSDPVIKVEDRPQVIPGTEVSKDPFTGEQKRQAGFAVRMESALNELEKLENAGFNPVNIKDTLVNNLPFVPNAVENYLSSAEYKQYQRAKIDFSTAQLRQETGAVINESEIVWINKTYFPEFGDDQKTILRKREARRRALAAMIGQAGKAYDRTKSALKDNEYGFESEEALDELKKRAQNNPDLKAKLIEKGIINE